MAHGPHGRDWGFVLWSLAGFLIVFGFIAGFSIGLPFFVAGVILAARLGARRPWPATLGLVAGAGVVCLTIATINAVSGDLSPTIWATTGVLLIASSSAAFWWLRCRPAVRRADGPPG